MWKHVCEDIMYLNEELQEGLKWGSEQLKVLCESQIVMKFLLEQNQWDKVECKDYDGNVGEDCRILSSILTICLPQTIAKEDFDDDYDSDESKIYYQKGMEKLDKRMEDVSRDSNANSFINEVGGKLIVRVT